MRDSVVASLPRCSPRRRGRVFRLPSVVRASFNLRGFLEDFHCDPGVKKIGASIKSEVRMRDSLFTQYLDSKQTIICHRLLICSFKWPGLVNIRVAMRTCPWMELKYRQ